MARRLQPEYSAWCHMKARCDNPNHPSYAHYGGRGITYDPSWALFENFERDMGSRPTRRHSLDRQDNDKGYSPSNCRWVKGGQQLHNRRSLQDKTSEYRGVCWSKKRGGWRATITFLGKQQDLGTYSDEEEAALAYDYAALKVYGGHANINFRNDHLKGRVVIFNGAPASGKDYACRYLSEKYGLKHLNFKSKLVEIVVAIYGLSEYDVEELSSRELKEIPQERLGGLSWRGALIKVSEEVIKPSFGVSYFGEAVAPKVFGNCCFSDGGFTEEVDAVVSKVGSDNLLVVNLTRQGCTFKGDSRKMLAGYPSYPLDNSGSLEDFENELDELFLMFFDEEGK